MPSISDTLNSHIPQISNEMAGGLIIGGGALASYGYKKMTKANGFQEKFTAGAFIATGLSCATVGTIGAISNLWQSVFFSSIGSVLTVHPNPQRQVLETCHTVFQTGIPANEMRIYSAERDELDSFMPPMQGGLHYDAVTGGMDSEGYLYCWARLTELGKQLLGKDTLKVHTAGIPGTVYAKIKMS